MGALAAALVLAWASLAVSFAEITRYTQPELSLRIWPLDGPARAIVADRSILSTATSGHPVRPSAAVKALARESAAAQPLNPRMVRVLGMIEDLDGRPDRARSYMLLAERLSRRDLATQLWLIEDGVRRNDFAGILAGYDLALRGNREVRPLLFERLLGAIGDEPVQRALRPYISESTPWFAAFVSFAVQNEADILPLVKTIERSGGMPKSPALNDLSLEVTRRLVELGHLPDAKRYFLANVAGADAVFNKTDFDSLLKRRGLGLFDWNSIDQPGVSVDPVRSSREVTASVRVEGPAESVRILRKLMVLPPGAYVLNSTLVSRSTGQATPVWRVNCAGSDGKATSEIGEGLKLVFNISPGCETQIIELVSPKVGKPGEERFDVTAPQIRKI